MEDDERSISLQYFTGVNNVGDRLNPYLIRELFGLPVHLEVRPDRRRLIAIGSFIEAANELSDVWGTGAIGATSTIPSLRSEMIHALRGKHTHKRLRENGLVLADMPLGEPGFLVSLLRDYFDHRKQYRIGIAAHYVDRLHPWVQKLLADPGVVDLNVHRPVEEFLARLAECETVVSSSLHGLVLAEAFGIPNVWVQLSDKVVGDGFKFRDWFSLADHPQTEPISPVDGNLDELVRDLSQRATLHDFRIDPEELVRAFPKDSLTLRKPRRGVFGGAPRNLQGLDPQLFTGFLLRRPQYVARGFITEPGRERPRQVQTDLPLFQPLFGELPSVSCVMVTANRPAQARVAVECYRKQTWPNRSMIIIDTGTDDALARWLADLGDSSIKYENIDRGTMTLGEVRNIAIQGAMGEYICNWDDDDLYHPLRIEGQMTGMLQARATVSILLRLLIWHPIKGRAVVSSRRPWEGSLLANRSLMSSYAAENRGEDTPVISALQNSARMAYLDAPELYVYVRHPHNTWDEDHFETIERTATSTSATMDYSAVLAAFRGAFPIDAYLDAICLS